MVLGMTQNLAKKATVVNSKLLHEMVVLESGRFTLPMVFLKPLLFSRSSTQTFGPSSRERCGIDTVFKDSLPTHTSFGSMRI
jgi:hypothetical protein